MLPSVLLTDRALIRSQLGLRPKPKPKVDEWMPEDASSTALRTRDFEPRLGNNVQSWVDHATESQTGANARTAATARIIS